ncbi:response regulator [Fusibacter tunisiensis]|uniref:Stage 0 sporulation protein A homolog n=1 Tax=Fusibacter tunisiensis TaxID=1008308 RepID=A0ABS2MSL1_9FIRM|nr:response regulator transcription factor [Fusibacter tunisiensis]MBM7562401.1 DNA-binding NarL/FixJ family response regulator [Fusibacter tunisiensis]
MDTIRIVIVDDHALIREGLKKLLELDPKFEIVGLADNGKKALEIVEKKNPDVVLLDINMPELNGIECLKKLKQQFSDVKVIMLTIHDDSEYLIETVNIGAEGYVLKDADVSQLSNAIQKVHNGEIYIHPSLSGVLVKEYKRKEDTYNDLRNRRLTKRELEVLKLIAQGINNRDISGQLFISEKTVKNHISSIFKKLGVNDRTQAALYAIKHNVTKI